MSLLGRLAMGLRTGFVAATYGLRQSVAEYDHWLLRVVGGGKTTAGPAVNSWWAIQYPVVYACMNRIANPLAMFPLGVMERSSNGGGVPVTQHPMSDRLSLRPNDFMSKRTLVKVGQYHTLSWGNGYLEIERNNAGEAQGLWALLSWNTAPQHDRSTGRRYYRTSIDGKQFEIDHGDVIHVMDLSQDGYVGMSPIACARQAIGMGIAMETFGGKFFANDAKSGGFPMHPGRLGGGAIAHINCAGRERAET